MVKAKHKKVTRGPKRPRVHYCTYPRGVEKQLGVSSVTRWRMERDGRLSKRDFFIGGEPVGWRPETLQAAIRPSA